MKAIAALLVFAVTVVQAKDVPFYKWITVRAKVDGSLLPRNPTWICLNFGEPVKGEIRVDSKTYPVSENRGVLLYGLSEGQLDSFRKQVGQEVAVTGKFEPAPSDRYPRYIIFDVR
jgi:hypothetical protein